MSSSLHALGYDVYRKSVEISDADGFTSAKIGRVSAAYQGMFKIAAVDGEFLGKPSGRLRHSAERRDELPAVGDWVVFRREGSDSQGLIERVLPRKSKFSRKQAGVVTEEQIVAANIDHVLIVMALNRDFNLKRLERYLLTAWDSGAQPLIVLTKADLCPDPEEWASEAESIAFGTPVIVTSALDGRGLDELARLCPPQHTAAFLGSSGVGKSSLINAWIGEDRQAVKDVRLDDQRGRHTTTHREMFVAPSGTILIDTPGMRELQLWDHGGALDTAFADVESIAQQCRFRDCNHGSEPGCAVRKALVDGNLSEERWESYQKLQAELAYLQRKEDVRAQLAHKKKWKKIAQSSNTRKKGST